ncbi:MAG: LysR substrate-binding domain-containing protein, partial [Burkholderiaceae bacterium]
VVAGDVDLAVGPDRATGGQVSSDALFESRWVLWCSPDHPLAQRKTLTWRSLYKQPLVAAGYDHERSVAQMRSNVPKESRVIPIEVVDNVTTALGIAAQGTVATLAPAYIAVLAHPLGLVMRRVLKPETVREVCVYRPLSRALSPAADGFAEHLLRWMPTWSAHVAQGNDRRGHRG